MTINDLYEKFIECGQRIATDTRAMEQGALFFAWKGEIEDGNSYTKEALEKGARYVIIDNPRYSIDERTILVENSMTALQDLAHYHRKKFQIPVIAIAGSNGKTTTKELLLSILSEQKNVIASFGSHNNHVGVPKTLLRINKLTDVAIIEMGANHIGEISPLCKMALPTAGLITNIGRDHIGLFGGEGAILEANLELYEHLKAHAGTIFVNANDPQLLKYTQGAARVFRYGEGIEGEQGIRSHNTLPFISFNWKHHHIQTKIIGEYNIENVAAALGVAITLNIRDEHIIHALSVFSPRNNRSELYESPHDSIVIKDFYNANRSSMEVALKNFERLKAKHPHKKSIVMLGDMFELGDFSTEDHTAVLKYAESIGPDEIILVGKEFASVAKNADHSSFLETNEALKTLSERNFQGCLILMKASNGMHFQSLFDALDY